MERRTKIIATLGPAVDTADMLQQLITAGVDVVRINMSHGTATARIAWLAAIRKISQQLDKEIGILIDLQGPKIRVAKFKNKKIKLNLGDNFILDANLAVDAGTEQTVGIDYKNLPQDVQPGDTLLVDDGRIVFEITAIAEQKIHCVVTAAGELSNNKGINRQGGGLSAEALTEKDKQDILFAAEHNADYVGCA